MPTVPPLKILTASAGSGKTFRLTADYLTLLFSGTHKYREILAITFTNKATAEMKGRILAVLEALARGTGCENDAAAGYRELLLDAYPGWDAATLRQRAAEIFRRVLHDYGRFAVSTIDGFTQKVIRGFTFELGIEAGYKLEMNVRKVKADLVLRLNRMLDDRPDLLQWIMDYAQMKIDRDENWNYRWALSELASEIFREDFQDFDKAVSQIPGEQLFTNLDRYCKTVIRQFEGTFAQALAAAADVFNKSGVDVGELRGKSRNYLGKLDRLSAQNPADVVSKLKKYVHEPDEWKKGGVDGRVGTLYDSLNPILEQLLRIYAEESPDYFLAKAIDENLYYLRLLKEMSALLAAWRRDNNAQLISDAQTLLSRIGTDGAGDPTFIWEKIGNRFRHFLFDEFQDTSKRQWENLRPLLVNAMGHAAGRSNEHLLVGDVKQSIYRWRSGDWRILLDRAERQIGQAFHVTDTGTLVRKETLDTNYRSHKHIVDFNNLVFKHASVWLQRRLNDRVRQELGDERYEQWWVPSGNYDTIERAYHDSIQQLPPRADREGGAVRVDFLPVPHNSHRPTAVKEEALRRMADVLIGWVSGGTYTPGQVGILVRTNNEAREVIQYLLDRQREKGMSFDVVSGEALTLVNNPAIRLLVATLQVLVGSLPDTALYRADCVLLYSRLHGKPVAADDWLRVAEDDLESLADLLPSSLCRLHREWTQLPLSELTETLVRAYGLHKLSHHLPYIFAFRDIVAGFSTGGERGIPAFLTYWEEEGADKALPGGMATDAVEVLTVHKSKGLAFDVVMIPFCTWAMDGKPNSDFWVDTTDTPYALLTKTPVKYKSELGKSSLYKAYFEEMLFSYMDALNTLYVATTRARRHLYITAPDIKGEGPVNTLVAGDLLLEVLRRHAGELNVKFDGGIDFGEPVADCPDRQSTSEGTFLSFDQYPTSDRLQAELGRVEISTADIVHRETARWHGQLLHELMATVIDPDGLGAALDRLQTEGQIQGEERDELHARALDVWKHPQLQEWLSGGYQHWSERSIILPDGRTLRPDKVLVSDDETIVIDFKFTQQEEDSHRRQVADYQVALRELGMPNVKGYIYYGTLRKLQAI